MGVGGARVGAGRKAKPREEHEREGTLVPSRHGEKPVRPADGKRPKLPSRLSVSAKAAWKALLDDLEADALLDSADAPLYEAFAVNFGRAVEAGQLIKKHGMLVEGAREGQLVANPMLRVEKDALQQVRMLSVELAIGMRTRASLGMAIARGARRGEPTPPAGEEPEALDTPDLGTSPRLTAVRGGRA